MKKASLIVLLTAGTLLATEELIPPTQPEVPVYACEDEQLESTLATTKEKAEQGDSTAAGQVYATYARTGHPQQAEAWYNRWLQLRETQAEQGDAAAQLEIGVIYLKGSIYHMPNPGKGVSLLCRALEQGEGKAALFLGAHFRDPAPEESRQFYAKAVDIYQQKVDALAPDAVLTEEDQLNLETLGDLKLNGLGTDADTAAAISCFEKSGSATAAAQLYLIYAKGIGIATDMKKALGYAQQLADLTPTSAYTGRMAWLLADSYLNGKNGVEKDIEIGEKYLNIADKENVVPAIMCQALRHRAAGRNKEAFICFSRAATMHEPEAMMHAALMQLHGAEGFEKNEEMGVEKLRRIANEFDRGHAWYVGRAPYELAQYYERNGAQEQADSWYCTASDRNVVQAMARRGLCHILPGHHMEWSPTLMYRWWKIGSEAGDATCSRYLNIFLWGVIPLILLIVFGLPILIVHCLNKRAAAQEE